MSHTQQFSTLLYIMVKIREVFSAAPHVTSMIILKKKSQRNVLVILRGLILRKEYEFVDEYIPDVQITTTLE